MKGGHSRQKVGLVICKSRLVLGVGMTQDYFTKARTQKLVSACFCNFYLNLKFH